MTSLHEVKIKTMCRICTNFIPKESKTYSKESIEKIIKIIYKDKEISDFSYDGPASHSNVLCGACHQKFHRLIKKHEEHKVHLRRNSKSESDFPFQPNATLPETIDNTFICTKDNSCPVCSLPGPGLLDSVENEESPSKKIKIDDEPKMGLDWTNILKLKVEGFQNAIIHAYICSRTSRILEDVKHPPFCPFCALGDLIGQIS